MSYIVQLEIPNTINWKFCYTEECICITDMYYFVLKMEIRKIHWDSLVVRELELSLKGGIMSFSEPGCPSFKEGSMGLLLILTWPFYAAIAAEINSVPPSSTKHQVNFSFLLVKKLAF